MLIWHALSTGSCCQSHKKAPSPPLSFLRCPFPFCLSSYTSCSLKLALRSSQLTRRPPPPPVWKKHCNPNSASLYILHPPFLLVLDFCSVLIFFCYFCLLSFLLPTFLSPVSYFFFFFLCGKFLFLLLYFSYLPLLFFFHPFILFAIPDTLLLFLFSFCLLFPCPPVLYPVLPCPTMCPVSFVSYILIFPVLGAGICPVPCPSSWTRRRPPPSSPLPSDLATIPIFSWQFHATFPFSPWSLPISLLRLSRYSNFFIKYTLTLWTNIAARMFCLVD